MSWLDNALLGVEVVCFVDVDAGVVETWRQSCILLSFQGSLTWTHRVGWARFDNPILWEPQGEESWQSFGKNLDGARRLGQGDDHLQACRDHQRCRPERRFGLPIVQGGASAGVDVSVGILKRMHLSTNSLRPANSTYPMVCNRPKHEVPGLRTNALLPANSTP